AFLGRFARSSRKIRQAERWRRRGRSGRAVAREAKAVAAALAASGVGAGDRVALYLNDGPLWHAAFFGVLRAGGVAVPLDVAFEPELLAELAAELGLAALCTEREVPRLELSLPRVDLDWRCSVAPGKGVPPWPLDDPDRIAEIVLTSGTGGAPKAVPVTHANVRSVLDGLAAGIEDYRWALGLAPPLRLAVALPLSHLYGQVMGVFLPPLLRAHVTLIASMPAPDLARALRDEHVWALASVPRTLGLLGRHLESEGAAIWGAAEMTARLEAASSRHWWRRPLAFASLRGKLGHRLVALVSGGAALEGEVEDLWRAMGYVVVQGYGLTETAPLVSLNHPFDTEPGSLGRPLPGIQVRITEGGEILVRGPNVVTARLGGSAVDTEGWLHTGDLGRRDATGRLYYLGRKGERIVTPAGVNVDPEPVVDRLRRQRGIHAAVVLERPWGERGVVCAVLAVEPGADPALAVRAANDDLPDAARVRSWKVWPDPDFPRTRTGKARRPEIMAWLEAQAPEASGLNERGEDAARPETPADAFTALARLVGRISGTDADELERSTLLADVLSSLDRVDLVTRIESTYGITMGPGVFAGDRPLGELADELFAGAASDGRGGASPSPIRAEPGRPSSEELEEEPVTHVEKRVATDTRGLGQRLDRVSEARWRHWALVRALRRSFRTGFLRPMWRSFFSMDVGGLEHLEGLEPPYIIAANHLSELDPGAILFALPERPSSRIATTAMWEYFPRARTGPFLYALGVWGLDLVPLVQAGDWRPTLRIAGSVADRAGSILVFPEGERSMDGHLLPFRKGVGVMAQELHLPIVPCGAAGLLAAFPKGRHWVRGCWLGRAPVAVRFGPLFPAPGPEDDPGEVVAELERRIQPLVEAARRAAGRF
ncbi:MAG: AMP-binding protein, partial [Gemmatimonadota bacterium]